WKKENPGGRGHRGWDLESTHKSNTQGIEPRENKRQTVAAVPGTGFRVLSRTGPAVRAGRSRVCRPVAGKPRSPYFRMRMRKQYIARKPKRKNPVSRETDGVLRLEPGNVLLSHAE